MSTEKETATRQKKVAGAPNRPGRPPSEAPVGDLTRTARAKAHLGRLDEVKGKRLVVDLDAAGKLALERLHEGGYGESQKAVVIKALLAAEKEFCKTPL